MLEIYERPFGADLYLTITWRTPYLAQACAIRSSPRSRYPSGGVRWGRDARDARALSEQCENALRSLSCHRCRAAIPPLLARFLEVETERVQIINYNTQSTRNSRDQPGSLEA